MCTKLANLQQQNFKCLDVYFQLDFVLNTNKLTIRIYVNFSCMKQNCLPAKTEIVSLYIYWLSKSTDFYRQMNISPYMTVKSLQITLIEIWHQIIEKIYNL